MRWDADHCTTRSGISVATSLNFGLTLELGSYASHCSSCRSVSILTKQRRLR
jgi:hypothetical protein